MAVEAGKLKNLTKKVTKKLCKEMKDDLVALFPHAKDEEGNPDRRLLASWLRLHSLIDASLNPHPSTLNIPLDDEVSLSFNVEEGWQTDELDPKCFITTYDDKGEVTKTYVKSITKNQILQLHAFTATTLAHYDK